ncbi:MAG: hypothetical protein FD167_829 [bacterium]|nr:MAG: hypothetical protein FD167_829 [bacterium]
MTSEEMQKIVDFFFERQAEFEARVNSKVEFLLDSQAKFEVRQAIFLENQQKFDENQRKLDENQRKLDDSQAKFQIKLENLGNKIQSIAELLEHSVKFSIGFSERVEKIEDHLKLNDSDNNPKQQ